MEARSGIDTLGFHIRRLSTRLYNLDGIIGKHALGVELGGPVALARRGGFNRAGRLRRG